METGPPAWRWRPLVLAWPSGPTPILSAVPASPALKGKETPSSQHLKKSKSTALSSPQDQITLQATFRGCSRNTRVGPTIGPRALWPGSGGPGLPCRTPVSRAVLSLLSRCCVCRHRSLAIALTQSGSRRHRCGPKGTLTSALPRAPGSSTGNSLQKQLHCMSSQSAYKLSELCKLFFILLLRKDLLLPKDLPREKLKDIHLLLGL